MKPRNQELHDMAAAHFNEPIIVGHAVGRLVGYGEDLTDCYLVVQHARPKGIVWHTCVGGYVFLDRLKGQGYVRSIYDGEDWDDFIRLDEFLALNGAPKIDKMIVDISDDDAYQPYSQECEEEDDDDESFA